MLHHDAAQRTTLKRYLLSDYFSFEFAPFALDIAFYRVDNPFVFGVVFIITRRFISYG